MQQKLRNTIEGLISFERCSNSDLRASNVDDEFHFDDRVTIGQGTYGKVYKVLSKLDGKFYALKEIKPNRPEYGFPITALREIKFLNKLQNPYLIKQQKICSRVQTKNNLTRIKAYCVMDFMDTDIYRLLKSPKMKSQNFSLPQIRSILSQILLGLKYLHENRIIHRDIKSANILVDKLGQVKIADFGLAKFIPLSELKNKTHNVVTLPYRAPEILFTRGNYDFKIDIWSFGCLAVELVTKKLCFDARNENEYIKQVFQLCGSPDESSWPDILKQDLYQQYTQQLQKQKFERQLFSIIRSKVPDIDNDLIDLINKTLVLNPVQRFDVQQALNHYFFKKGNQEEDQMILKSYFQDIKVEALDSRPEELNKKKEINIDIEVLASQPIKRIKL